jgi:hypothetical protein
MAQVDSISRKSSKTLSNSISKKSNKTQLSKKSGKAQRSSISKNSGKVQEKSVPKKSGKTQGNLFNEIVGIPQRDSLANTSGATQEEPPSSTSGAAQEESPSSTSGAAQEESPSSTSGAAQEESPSSTSGAAQEESPSSTSGATQESGTAPSNISGAAQEESPSKNIDSPQGTDSPDFAGISRGDSVSKKSDVPQSDSPSKKSEIESEYDGMPNIILTEKGIRAQGWGEYRVGGRCLCCDNALDGDCIIVQSTNRTDQVRIKQVVDGKIEADTNDKKTYFGEIDERENAVPVKLLMIEIAFKNMFDIYKVTVYTMVDNEKKKNYLSNCEIGYYDQFDRLQWAGKAESNWYEDHISFELKKPILTKSLLLKVQNGKSRITEVAVFGKKVKE